MFPTRMLPTRYARFDEASRELAEALKTFESMGARFEVAPTCLDLAPLLHDDGDRAVVALLT